MTTLKVSNFAGVAPRYSARLLPNNAATRADNAKLLSGELRGLRETTVLHDFNDTGTLDPPIVRAYRLPTSVAAPIPIQQTDQWIGFTDAEVDFVRTPVTQDSFERYYYTGDGTTYSGVPKYNTRARINADLAPFRLGIPTPVAAPSVTPPAGVASTRAYVYTFVSAYGEEGPPSPPTLATGNNGTWVIAGFDDSGDVPDETERNITTKRIYRTVSGNSSTEYFFVADIDIDDTTYNDNATDISVALNNPMISLTFTGPPTTLKGLISHPGGFLVGFSGRDLWMSEPYAPHAWPIQYVKTMQTEIVGVAIYNNVIVVATTSHPYIAEGMDPLAITFQKIDSIDPCVSRRSIATTLDGVYYSSPQGIIKVTGGKTDLSTRSLFTREEWQLQFSPTTVQAVPYGVQYIAFDTSATGFIFSPAEQDAPLTTLDRFSNVSAIQIDQYSGDVYLVQASQVRLWDPPESIAYTYTWQSKEFDLPEPLNMGAFRLKFAPGRVAIDEQALLDYQTFNEGRILFPLNCIGLAVLGGVRREVVDGYQGPQNRNPIGGSPLFPIARFQDVVGAVQVDIYYRTQESIWRTAFSWTITSEKIYRLPTGFKSDCWQVRLIGNVPVYNFALAETGKELKQV